MTGSKDIKRAIASLEKALNLLEQAREKREDQYHGRTYRWKDSERGEIYQDLTDQIDGVHGDTELLIDSIKEILEL